MKKLRAMVADHAFNRQAALLLGPAAFNTGAFNIADILVREAVDLLREGGRLGYLPRMLTVLGIVSARLAEWNTAIPAAEEARRLAAEIGAPQWAGGGASAHRPVAGMRGCAAAA